MKRRQKDPDMHEEYDFSKGVQGKYTKRYAEEESTSWSLTQTLSTPNQVVVPYALEPLKFGRLGKAKKGKNFT